MMNNPTSALPNPGSGFPLDLGPAFVPTPHFYANIENLCNLFQFQSLSDSLNEVVQFTELPSEYENDNSNVAGQRCESVPIIIPDDRNIAGPKGDSVPLIIHNIPFDFIIKDLRSFFFHFIEAHGFECFHYLYRPEIRSDRHISSTNCCIIKVHQPSKFIEFYNDKIWTDSRGKSRETRCEIEEVIIDDDVCALEDLIPKEEKRRLCRLGAEQYIFHSKDFISFLEFHPPNTMPNGNVGTTRSQLWSLIQSGKFSCETTEELGLEFLRNEGNSIYQDQKLLVKEANHNVLYKDVMKYPESERKELKNWGMKMGWQRSKRWLWGNGVSHIHESATGVNYYQEEEETTESVDIHTFAGFDKYSNGIGRKLMEAQGWRPGQGIGKYGSGVREPLSYNGQNPTDRSGLGYEKPEKKKKKKKKKDSDNSENFEELSALSKLKLKYQTIITFIKSPEILYGNSNF